MSLPPEVQTRLILAKADAKERLHDELERSIDNLFELALSHELPSTSLTSLSTSINFDLNINLSEFPGIDVSCCPTSLSMIPNTPEVWNFTGQLGGDGGESSADDFQDAPSSPIVSIPPPSQEPLQQSISPELYFDPIAVNDSLNSSSVNPAFPDIADHQSILVSEYLGFMDNIANVPVDNHKNIVLEDATKSFPAASSLFTKDVNLCAPMDQVQSRHDTSPVRNSTHVPFPDISPMSGLADIQNQELPKKLPNIESPKKQENKDPRNVTKPFASFGKIPKISANKHVEVSDASKNNVDMQLWMNADNNNAAPVEKSIPVEEDNHKPPDNNVNPSGDYVNPVSIRYINCIVPACSKTCPSNVNLNIHLIEAHRIMENRCPAKSCKFNCNKLSKLLKHRKSAHGHLKSWNCDKCNKSFPDQLELSDHKEVEHTRGRFECGRGCGYWSEYRQPVKDHFRSCGKEAAVANGDTEKEPPKVGSSSAPTYKKRPAEVDMHEVKGPGAKKQKTFLVTNTAEPSTSRSNSLDQFVDSQLKAIRQSVKMTATTSASVMPDRYRTEYLYCLKSGCEWTCPNSLELNDHLKVAHNIQNYRCPLFSCKASFAESEKLRRHNELVHRKVTSWQCFACKDMFASSSKLSRHIELMHNVGRFGCVIKGCLFFGECRQEVIEHYNSDHQKNDKVLTTTIVRSTSPSASPTVDRSPPAVVQSVDHSVKYEIVSVKCLLDSCTEFFLSNEKLNIHLVNVHRLLPVLCPVSSCQSSFKDRLELDRHVVSDHCGVTQWKCAKCGLIADDHTHLGIHQRDVHHEGFFKCSFAGPPPCRKLLKYRAEIIQHYEVHKVVVEDIA